MDQKFTIIVEAKDKAAAVFAGVKKAVGNITTPLAGVAKAAGAVERETAKMVGALTSVAAPLAAITGVASVAGVAALATEWAHLGAEVARTAQTIGISTDALQSLRGAASLTGVSTDALSGGLKALGGTMEDALYGRNQEALIMMNRLGLRLHKTADGAVDTERAFTDMSEAIMKIKNPQVQGLVARTFGLEEALPLLRKGPAALAAYRAEARRLGADMSGPQVAAAAGFEQSLGGLSLAVQGVKNAIGSDLIPILQPMIERFRDWLAANRAIIAADISHVVDGLAKAIDAINWDQVLAGAKEFYQDLKDGIAWIGGWKNAAIALAAVIEGPLIASFVTLSASLVRLGAVALANPLVRTLSILAVAGYELYEHWSEIPGILKDVGVGIAGFSAATFGVTPALGIVSKSIKIVTSILPALSGGFGVVTTAIRVASAAIMSNPIGLIAGAIAIAGYEIYKNWDTIGPFFKKLWDDVTAIFDAAWAKIKTIVDAVIDAGKSVGLINSKPLAAADVASTAAQVAPDIDNPNDIVSALPKKPITTANTGPFPASITEDLARLDNPVAAVPPGAPVAAAPVATPDKPNGVVAAIPKAAQTSVVAPAAARMAADQAPAAHQDDATDLDQGAAPSASASGDTAAPPGASGAVTVLVRFENAPRNMKASVRTTGPVAASTSIAYTLPTVTPP